MNNLTTQKLVPIFSSKFCLAMIFSIMAMTIFIMMPVILSAAEPTANDAEEDIDSRMKRVANEIAELQKEITEYAVGAVEDTNGEEVLDSELSEKINAIKKIITYTKPAGTLMWGINEALMTADIDLRRMRQTMERTGEDLSRDIESMQTDREKAEKMKQDIKQIYEDAVEVKRTLRKERYNPHRNRVAQFHNIVTKMKTIINTLNKTVDEVKKERQTHYRNAISN